MQMRCESEQSGRIIQGYGNDDGAGNISCGRGETVIINGDNSSPAKSSIDLKRLSKSNVIEQRIDEDDPMGCNLGTHIST